MLTTKRLLIIGLLACLVFSGCQKKQPDAQPTLKPQQVTAPAPTPASTPAATSAAAPDQPPAPAKPSEQQERALRRYNENAWFIQQAMQVGRWDEALAAGITKMVKAATPDWDQVNPSHREIRGPEVAAHLRPWMEAVPKLDLASQAAALLVADRIVVMEEQDDNLEPLLDTEKPTVESEHSETRPKSPAQLELEKLGAQFSYDSAGERYFYTFNWLQQAYKLDPKGRIGDLAFLLLMGRGFELLPACANGSDQFREVIRRGEEYLREHHNADIEARTHFLIGDAYRDIVTLASGQLRDTYANPADYQPEAADARTKAITQYHAGLALDATSEVSVAAKERLQVLESGQTPDEVRFYCQVLD